MVQVLRGDNSVTDPETPLDKVVEYYFRLELIQRDGETGVLHLPCQRLLQG